MYRLSSPFVVRIWHKMVFWREIKTPAHLRHCRDSSKVKSLHLGPAMSPESPAPREPGIQMTGALRTRRAMPPDLYLEICFLFFVKSSYPLIETKSISSSFVSCKPMKSYVDKKVNKVRTIQLRFQSNVFKNRIFKRSLYWWLSSTSALFIFREWIT